MKKLATLIRKLWIQRALYEAISSAKRGAREISDSSLHCEVWISIARITRKRRDFAVAMKKAFAVDPYIRDYCLWPIFKALIEMKDLNSAVKLVSHLADRESAWLMIAESFAGSGDFHTADKMISNLVEKRVRYEAMATIARLLAEKRNIESARRIASEIPVGLSGCMAWASIAGVTRDANDFGAATEVASALSKQAATQGWAEITKSMIASGDFEAAEKAAWNIPDDIPPDNDTTRYEGLILIVASLARCEDFISARRIAAKIPDPYRPRAFATIARFSHDHDDVDSAKTTATRISDPVDCCEVWGSIAAVTHEKEDFEVLRKTAACISDDDERSRALIKVAKLLTQTTDLDSLRQAAAQIGGSENDSSFLLAVTKSLVRIQGFEAARKAALEIPDAETRCEAFAGISRVTRNKEDWKSARRAAAEVTRAYWRCESLLMVARSLAGIPEPDRPEVTLAFRW
jgi:hypothetical protein